MSCTKGTQDGEKTVPHLAHESGDVYKVLARWAGTNERRWQMITVLALQECADWTQEMIAQGLRLSQGRIAQIAAEAKTEIPKAFAPSLRDLAGAG